MNLHPDGSSTRPIRTRVIHGEIDETKNYVTVTSAYISDSSSESGDEVGNHSVQIQTSPIRERKPVAQKHILVDFSRPLYLKAINPAEEGILIKLREDSQISTISWGKDPFLNIQERKRFKTESPGTFGQGYEIYKQKQKTSAPDRFLVNMKQYDQIVKRRIARANLLQKYPNWYKKKTNPKFLKSVKKKSRDACGAFKPTKGKKKGKKKGVNNGS